MAEFLLGQRQVLKFEGDDQEFGFGGDVPNQFGGFGGGVLRGRWVEGEEIGPILAAAAAGKIYRECPGGLIEQFDGAAGGFGMVGEGGGGGGRGGGPGGGG